MFFSKAKIFLTALFFFLLGVLLAILTIQNKEKIISFFTPKLSPIPTLSPTPTAEEKLLANCQTYTNSKAGIELCLPEAWVVKTEEGPKGTSLASIVLQSPNFTSRTFEEGPTVKLEIENGAQLNISVTRITAGSSLTSFEALKEFWHLGRGGHAIEREEEIFVADKQALYHVLTDIKPATAIDTHFISDRLVYDLIYYASPELLPRAKSRGVEGEKLYREILETFKFLPTDAMISLTSGLEIVNPRSEEEISLPYLVIILDSAGIVSSSRERPTLVVKNQTTQELANLSSRPSAGSGEYETSWQKGTPGEYQIVAEVIKEDGQIFESSPVQIIVH